MPEGSTTQLQVCLDRLNGGDPAARDALIARSCERLRRLTRKMLRDYQRLKSWQETDDVFQSALMRLLHALQAMPPTSVEEFFRLASRQIRRQLLDLVRHYYGPEGPGAKEVPAAADPQATNGPAPAGARC